MSFCLLIEHLSTSNSSENYSRYLEIPRETSWVDALGCTRCSCSSAGLLHCEHLRASCPHPCLHHKRHPFPISYYFPSDSTWFAPVREKCRSCSCDNGQRSCSDCNELLKINIGPKVSSPSLGEFRLLSASETRPCLLTLQTNAHRLIYPGQQTWFEERCYFCSKDNGRLLRC